MCHHSDGCAGAEHGMTWRGQGGSGRAGRALPRVSRVSRCLSDWKDVRCERVLDRAAVTCWGNPTWAGRLTPALAHVNLSSSWRGGVKEGSGPSPTISLPPECCSCLPLPAGQPCFYVLYFMSCFQPAHPGCGVHFGNWLSPWRSPTLQVNRFPTPSDKIKSISLA